METEKLSRREQTAMEIDARLHELVLKFLRAEASLTTAETLGYLRAAYASGYTDCLKEPELDRGKWIRDLGYGVKGIDL